MSKRPVVYLVAWLCFVAGSLNWSLYHEFEGTVVLLLGGIFLMLEEARK